MLVIRLVFCVAIIVLGVVSMWTTYVSVRDSILPEPMVRINLGSGVLWDCSVFALGLSVAIGLMLFAMKVAIINEQKRLNLLGLAGMTIIAFISIAFNLDVLYRTADHDFFIRFSTERMKSVYENFMAESQSTLVTKQERLRKIVAKQEGELDAEIRGLREAPRGYGRIARQEDYQLTLLQKTTAVELETVEAALARKEEADQLLRSTHPKDLDEIAKLQSELRVITKDIGAASGQPLPEAVKEESPLFAVFSKVLDWKQVGIKEIFFVLLAFIMDLGDIIGYSLIPNRPKKVRELALAAMPDLPGPEMVLRPQLDNGGPTEAPLEIADESQTSPRAAELPQHPQLMARRTRRPFRFRLR
jgi:hypothetical protein